MTWPLEDGRVESWLIDPSAGVPTWSEWDPRVERKIHGISREMLRFARAITPLGCRAIECHTLAGKAVFCDAPKITARQFSATAVWCRPSGPP